MQRRWAGKPALVCLACWLLAVAEGGTGGFADAGKQPSAPLLSFSLAAACVGCSPLPPLAPCMQAAHGVRCCKEHAAEQQS